MIINNSKKALAAKIRNSGFVWPDSGKWAIQDKDGEVFVCSGTSVPVRRMGEVNWEFGEPYRSVGILSLGSNWFQCILSRDEYFHLYPVPDTDGWIEWNGGECPVRMNMVDVKFRQGSANNQKAHTLDWSINGDDDTGDIIAYRLHKPEQQKSTAVGDDDTNLAAKEELEAMGYRPSIEQLAADYKAKLAIAQRAQEEADSHRCGAEAALKLLELAGAKLGLVIGVCETQKQEAELNITDWRDLKVGDIIWCEAEDEYVQAGEKEVLGIEIPGYYGTRAIRVLRDGGRSYWINTDLGWHFIRRP